MKSQNPFFEVVLVEPEIPQNTGNIGRTCVGTNCRLSLIGKLGFEITDRNLKRSGLDYWQYLQWKQFSTFEEWLLTKKDPSRIFYLSTKAKKAVYEVSFKEGDSFVFGKETKGLDPQLLEKNVERALRIPQYGPVRSLNLASAVGVVVYEGIRQLNVERTSASSIMPLNEILPE